MKDFERYRIPDKFITKDILGRPLCHSNLSRILFSRRIPDERE
jgi:hypothetical protein